MNRQDRLLHIDSPCDCSACETEQIQKNEARPLWQKVLFLIALAGILFMASCHRPNLVAAAEPVLSPHFTKSEFNQHPRPLPLDSFEMDERLINKLESLRRICRNRPIIITSGYRTVAHNAQVGGARHSQHLLGRAADIRVQGIDNRMLANYARIVGFTFVKVYTTHVHVDVR